MTAHHGTTYGGGVDVETLRGGLEGQILLPGEGAEEARRVWNAMVDKRPAVIARCASTADVEPGYRVPAGGVPSRLGRGYRESRS